MLVRRFFRLAPFRTQRQWLGTVVRVSRRHVQYYTALQHYPFSLLATLCPVLAMCEREYPPQETAPICCTHNRRRGHRRPPCHQKRKPR